MSNHKPLSLDLASGLRSSVSMSSVWVCYPFICSYSDCLSLAAWNYSQAMIVDVNYLTMAVLVISIPNGVLIGSMAASLGCLLDVNNLTVVDFAPNLSNQHNLSTVGFLANYSCWSYLIGKSCWISMTSTFVSSQLDLVLFHLFSSVLAFSFYSTERCWE